MQTRAKIHVTGVVQGVGFRPFVYRTAVNLQLLGYVLNLGDAGVEIVVEGESENILKLVNAIKDNSPSISKIESINILWEKFSGQFSKFMIKKSDAHRSPNATPEIPPDIAICKECIKDIYTPKSRWYQYPFTSCSACGPRFSTITDLPYDRPNTTMIDFPLCDSCNTGYTNPLDRRYHAQTTACPVCGPQYQLLGQSGNIVEVYNAVKKAGKLIAEGYILAIHGIGGTHLVTKTSTIEPIRELRRRKKRYTRPFAIMAKDLEGARRLAFINDSEAALLSSWRRPIVLVKKKDVIPVSHVSDMLEEVAPGIDTIGIMLPYSAIHHLLFDYTSELALVMTSGNPSGIPMYIDINTITTRLRNIADYCLVHNRRIAQRIDDSVIKPLEKGEVFIRRSRGYVPDPIRTHDIQTTLQLIAVGPEEKATGAVYKSGTVYLTQHIGNTNNIESLNFLQEAINHMVHLIGVHRIDGVGCDLHPEFLSSELATTIAEKEGIPIVKTQHHHAHLISLLVDNDINSNTDIVCITADGYGYGEDGTAWGGEVLVGNSQEYTNRGGLVQQNLPGGDLSALFPVRSFLGILGIDRITSKILKQCEGAELGPNIQCSDEHLRLLLASMERKLNTIHSSSAGRFLDAVAFALGVSAVNSYNGEAPMKLEAVAKETNVTLNLEYTRNGNRLQIDTATLLEDILQKREQRVPVSDLAYSAQWHLGKGLAEIAIYFAEEYGIRYVGFSGGVALNRIITRSIRQSVEKNNLALLLHRQIPPGDGGISLGQIVHTATVLEDNSSNNGNT